MKKIDFNNNFMGFKKGEDILVDTGVLFALLNKYDAWHKTVNDLFNNFVFNNDDVLFLYINPCIQNELTNLIDSSKLIKFYDEKYPQLAITKEDVEQIETNSVLALEKLLGNEVLIVLNSNKESLLQQLKLFKELGAADAINVTLANEYGISFLTLDNRLVSNIQKNADKLSNIQNVYYTIPIYRTY